jgi:CDP-glucose 4,6-dehydratase
MAINREFWAGKKVFLTGHTGFKGSWASMLLTSYGAKVFGYSLQPPSTPNLFKAASVEKIVEGVTADVRDVDRLIYEMDKASPEIVIHMAAQPLVRLSYETPVDTFSTNIMGTVNVLEAVRLSNSVKAFLNVTTDKCYSNNEWDWGYRETDSLGGIDPYSSSKTCSEIITTSYRESFLENIKDQRGRVAIASARAGNVIGGGDWAIDRLIPDIIRAFEAGETAIIRNPNSIRPWQFVLEPLTGYLKLIEKMYEGEKFFSSAWNFGPAVEDAVPVLSLVKKLANCWSGDVNWSCEAEEKGKSEANFLKLDTSKARANLGWKAKLNIDGALEMTCDWHKAFREGKNMFEFSNKQIAKFEEL